MDNQHQKIKGYRDLTQAEIDLMNKIKAHAEATDALCAEIGTHLTEQRRACEIGYSPIDTTKPVPQVSEEEAKAQAAEFARREEENRRLAHAQPNRWLSMAVSDLQVGFMKLVRSVAQPTTF